MVKSKGAKRSNRKERAKARATEAVRKVRSARAPKRPPASKMTTAEALRVLEEGGPLASFVEATQTPLEEPNGQRVIPGAGPRKSATDAQPGDENEYVMTLRIKRRDARQARLIAALLGYQYPASWVIDVLRKAIAAELAKSAA